MGSGVVGAYGLQGLQAAIRQRVAEQMAQKKAQLDMELAERRQALDEQDLKMRAADREEMRENSRLALAERAQVAKETAAGKAYPSIGIGNAVEEPVFDQAYRGTASEAGFTPERTLPSMQTAGGMPLDRGEAGVQSTQEAPRQITGRMISMGTDAQRETAAQDAHTQDILNDPNTPPMLKGYLRARQADPTVPAKLFDDPNASFNEFTRKRDYEIANPTREPNRSLDEIEEESAARARGAARVDAADNPQNPRGVQTYLLDLRNRYGNDLQTAEQELARAWPAIMQAHPRAAAATVVGALRNMFGNAPGASANQLPPGVTMPRFDRREAPTAGPGTAQTPAPSGQGRASGMQPGAVLKLRDGSRVRVVSMNADGTPNVEPVQ